MILLLALVATGWVNVTPPGFSLSSSVGMGATEIVADPSHPGTVYLGSQYQGIWKSPDAGTTWAKVSATGSLVDSGRNWGMGISKDGTRLYTFSGYSTQPGSQGLLISRDGGVTWSQTWHDPTGGSIGKDLYMIDVDPADDTHLLMTVHGNAPVAAYNDHVVESHDGGATWRDAGSTGVGTGSGYVYFLSPTKWLHIAQWSSNVAGTRISQDSGATWTRVNTLEHGHGAHQLAVVNGVIYLPGIGGSLSGGVLRSLDGGATWTNILSLNGESVVISDGAQLFASYGWSTTSTNNPNLRRAPVGADTTWTADPTPTGMTNGPKRCAFAGVVICAQYLAGVWRYAP